MRHVCPNCSALHPNSPEHSMLFLCGNCDHVWKREACVLVDEPPKNAGRKDDSQKARYDLVPPGALDLVVQALTYGARKYGDDNWRRVKDGRRRYFAALMRHAWEAFRRPKSVDPESGLPHFAHAGACILFLLEPLEGDAEA